MDEGGVIFGVNLGGWVVEESSVSCWTDWLIDEDLLLSTSFLCAHTFPFSMDDCSRLLWRVAWASPRGASLRVPFPQVCHNSYKMSSFQYKNSTPGLHPSSTKKSRVAGVMDPCLHPKITAVPDQVLSFLSSQRWDDKYRAYGIEDSVHLFQALLSEPSPRRMTPEQLALPFYGLQKRRSTNQQSRIRMRLHQANRESRLRNFSYQRIRLETFLDSESNRLGPRVWVSCFLLEVVGPPSTETGRGVATRGIGATRMFICFGRILSNAGGRGTALSSQSGGFDCADDYFVRRFWPLAAIYSIVMILSLVETDEYRVLR